MDFAGAVFTFQTLSQMVNINCDTKSLLNNSGSWKVNGCVVKCPSVPDNIIIVSMACFNMKSKVESR
jgi:hypothetical protein